MNLTVPMGSYEVRWFFDGDSAEHDVLERWFDSVDAVAGSNEVIRPVKAGRLDGQPDRYLLLPGHDDVGIKWREGMLQIKGLVARMGVQVFGDRHRGRVERWTKWSFAGLPPGYASLFSTEAHPDLVIVPVTKTRAMRKVRLNTFTGRALEVDSTEFMDRGIGIELTDIEVAGKAYCSLGFEAYPDDSAMQAAFASTVHSFLRTLTGMTLDLEHSMSYAAWLKGR